MNLFKLINEYETIANEKPLMKSINEYLKLAQDYSGDYTTANDHWVFKSQDSKTKALFGDTDKGKHVSAEEVIAQMTDYSGVKFVGTADNGNLIYDWTHSKYCHVRFYVLSESQLSEKLKSELIDGDLSSYEQIFTKVAVKPLHDYNEDLKIGKWYVFSFDEFTKLDTKFGRLSSMFEKLYNSNNPESREEPKTKENQQPKNNLNAKLSKELISLRDGFNNNVDQLISLMDKKLSLGDSKIINSLYNETSVIINYLIGTVNADYSIDQIIKYSDKLLTNLEHEVNVYFSNKSSKNYDILKIFDGAFKDFLQIIRETLEMASYGEESMMESEFYTLKRE